MKYLVNLTNSYKYFDYYDETYKDLFLKRKIKTIIFYKNPWKKLEKIKNDDYIEFIKYNSFEEIKEKIEKIWKENIFYINTFDEKMILETNKLKKDLWFSVSKKYEIFRDKEKQRKFLLENFPETTVNFQEIDLQKNAEIKIDFPCIIKPTGGLQSAWVNFLKNKKDFENFKENFNSLNEKLEKRGLWSKFILEEFIDWQMYTVDYFVDENWDFFAFPIVKIELASKLWVDDFANYARIAWKYIEKEVSNQELYEFIDKNVKTFWLKNTFVHHEFKKNSSWKLKTIELNGRIWWYRCELYKECFSINMFDIVLEKEKNLKKEENFYAAFVFYPDKEGILKGFDEKIESDFKKLDSFFSLSKIWKIWENIWLTKNWYSSVANLKLKNKNLENFQKDLDFVWKNYKDFLILE